MKFTQEQECNRSSACFPKVIHTHVLMTQKSFVNSAKRDQHMTI
jgi:hypothetical protein